MTHTPSQKNETEREKGPSELVVGLVTFIIFIVFMTAWMYFVPSS